MTAYCHFCKLPVADGQPHPRLEDCVAALRAELDRSEVWLDNQRLQRALSANQRAVGKAVGVLRAWQLEVSANEVEAIAKGDR